MKKSVLLGMLFLSTCFIFQIAFGKEIGSVWGPENQGLRMNLNIQSADKNQPDVYKVVIKLINVGKESIVLIAKWDFEEDKGDYNEFFKTNVVLTSFPEVRVHSAQTMAQTKRHSPQPTLEIKPGKVASFEWITAKRLLKPKDFYNTLPDIFPNDGLYGIRARFLANTKQGNRILLYSEEFLLPVGKSSSLPKFAIARIVQSNPDQNTVLLDVGSDQKIEPNDVFEYVYFPAASWEIRIMEVNDTVSTGLVKLKGRDPQASGSVPAFPPAGGFVSLVPVSRLCR
jgi:hypothetical protein